MKGSHVVAVCCGSNFKIVGGRLIVGFGVVVVVVVVVVVAGAGVVG